MGEAGVEVAGGHSRTRPIVLQWLQPLGKLRSIVFVEEHLGHANDVSVASELLAALRVSENPAAIGRAAGVVLGWHDRGLADHERKLLKHVRRFRHARAFVGSSRVDLQACKLEYSIVSPK